jgi:RNA-directed DNA polymerase
VRAFALVAASMVAMAGDVKLDLSMRIARHGDLAEVAFAAEVSVVAAQPCAVDGCPSTVGAVRMGDPNGEHMRSLFEEVRNEQNVFAAWRHVKRSALTSGNTEIKGQAAEFEHEHQKHLRRLTTQLREGRFKFDPVKGVLKDKKKRLSQGKDPRPIAIATLQNRVVQRAILQVLQPRVLLDPKDPDSRSNTKIDDRLGKINDVNHSKYGVGGLMNPYGGVRPAIRSIREAIDGGAKYFYQSDIRSFFTKIPTATVVDFVRRETQDDALSDLFAAALEVHLANPEELEGYTQLFPKGGIGVAQGSSLSAFAGNVLLYDMDHALNDIGVTAIRYIDDILMVSPKEADLEAAISCAEKTLTGFGFGLYKASDGSGKADRGECASSITFLGCTIQPNRCVPSKQSVQNMRNSVTEALSNSKAAIREAIRKGGGLDIKLSQSATLDAIGRRLYGWQKAFAFCTDLQAFQQLDDHVANHILDYQEFVRRSLKGKSAEIQMLVYGIPSTRALFAAHARVT